jgi:multidrug efflux pump subunit AcrA (membrane-fusion protein)
LKPGQFATVRLLGPHPEPAVLIPQRGVITDNSGSSRAFVIKDGHVEQRLVQLGQREGDLVAIKTGIAADELVATSNLEQLSDGAPVRQ